MVKIRVFYDYDREITEMIKLLSPRLNYCRTFPDEIPKKAFCGIETSDLLVAEEEEGGTDDV